MKKKIIAALAILLFISSVVTLSVINYRNNAGAQEPADNTVSDAKTYLPSEDALEAAAFRIMYSDRLCGYPATGYYADNDTAEISYGGYAITRKSLAEQETADDYSETAIRDIDGISVTFKGRDGRVYLALWEDNNFFYTIMLENVPGGVAPDEMAEYVRATR